MRILPISIKINTTKYNSEKSNYTRPRISTDNSGDIFFTSKEKKYEDYDFVSKHHAEYFENLSQTHKHITTANILDKLDKISSLNKLEGHNKLNLVEHVLTKEANGENRNFDELIDNVNFFSKNSLLNSILISDSAKYALEMPEMNKEEFNDILTTVVLNQQNIEPQYLMKTSKILLHKQKDRQEFIELIKKGLEPHQIKYIALLPEELYSQLKNAKSLEDIEAKYDYFISLKFANQDIFNSKMKNFSTIFPCDDAEAKQTLDKLQKIINTEYPLTFVQNKLPNDYENLSKEDDLVLDICKFIIKNSEHIEKLSPSKNYQLRAFQSINMFKHLETEQQKKICKILSAYGHYQEKEPNDEAISLILRYKNCFEMFKLILPPSENLTKIENYINFLKFNTHPIIQDNFEDAPYKIVTFNDGTVNKIIEYNNKNNPTVILHSGGYELAQILPNKNNLDKETLLINLLSNKIISGSVLTEDDYKPFRTYGFVIHSDMDDILGGYPYDIATGYDKDIEHYGAKLLKVFSPLISYFPGEIKNKYNLSDIDYLKLIECINKNDTDAINKIKQAEYRLGATERLDGRKYNEYLFINPIITGMYAYGKIELIPYKLRKFAQDNNLKILHIKTRNINHQ